MTEHKKGTRAAVVALLLGTVFWGCGFTWAKAGGQAVSSAARLPVDSAFGPLFLLAWRFVLAGILWVLIFPSSRRGWTLRGAARGCGVGVLLGLGLISQHLGLNLTSEAVSAFLTSLTILFVPLLMTAALRKPPPSVLWLGAGLATLGVWLMTGATPAGFGMGEILGLACSFAFSLYILAVNAVAATEDPARMAAAQFLVTGLMCTAACFLPPSARSALHLGQAISLLAAPTVGINLALLTIFTTICAFGLLTFFQPRLDPTRAALIYLFEPIVATVYAAVAAGHRIVPAAVAGAGLILAANLIVELLAARLPKGAMGTAPI